MTTGHTDGCRDHLKKCTTLVETSAKGKRFLNILGGFTFSVTEAEPKMPL